MSARMEKYDTDNTVKQRIKKNEALYSKVSDMNIDYVDINNAMELNPSKRSRASREDYQKERELNKILPSKEKASVAVDVVKEKDDRVYDINEILKMAREDKLFENPSKRRLINTEYNILTKLDVSSLDKEDLKKEDLRSLIDDIYEKEMPKKAAKITKYKRSEEEKLLSDLFENMDYDNNTLKLEEDLSKEILNEEKEEEKTEDKTSNEEVKINEEIVSQIITDDKTEKNVAMYDFGLEKKRKKKKEKEENQIESEEEYSESEDGKGLIIAIIIVVLLILLTCAFFLYQYFLGT